MPLKKRFITCEICGLRASRKQEVRREFMAKFPLDEARCKEWVRVVGKEDLAYVPIEKLHSLKYLCGQHFKSNDFNENKNRLKKFAVPSLNLKSAPLSDEILIGFPLHIFSNTEISAEPNTVESECDGEASLDPEEEITGFSHLELTISNQPQLLDHDYSLMENIPQSRKRKNLLYSDIEKSPRKRKLIKKLCVCQPKNLFLRQGNKLPHDKFLALKVLIKSYIRNSKKKPHGKYWTSIEKAFALAIYKKSSRMYTHFQRFVALPSVRTLQTLLQNVGLEPGISPTILDQLRRKAAILEEKDKLCALLFDEIALKKQLFFNPFTDKVEGFVDFGEDQCRFLDMADRALVFMLQGLNKKIKEPIAYFFGKGRISSQNLAILIKQVIKAVTDNGYTVITTVCDQGPTNIGSLNWLKAWSGVPAELNYFILNDEKIFIMFDIPHLFKSLRNNFHNGGELVIDGKKAKWSHLIDVVEKNNSTLHFQKLTALHVNPTLRAKTKVKLAAQLLSNTVAAILKLMAEKNGKVKKAREILETAQIVEELDRLFDCTNGPASKKDIIRHRRENVSKKTDHLELWAHYKQKLSKMCFLKSDSFLTLKNVRCVQGYTVSLSTLEDIWKLLESKGFKYLNLRQLNQESLENFFGMIRQHCPTNGNPTCDHFTAALKSIILTKLSPPVSKEANCEEDENEAIIDFEDFFQYDDNDDSEKVKEQSSDILDANNALSDHEFPNLKIFEEDAEHFHMGNSFYESFEKQPTVYVAGYLASVVLEKMAWQCEHCKFCLRIENPELMDTTYDYIKLCECWPHKKSVTYPTINLCKLVDTATACFDLEIKQILHQRHVSNQAITLMLTKFDDLSWVCNDHRDWLLHTLLACLCHLLIRNECQQINLSFPQKKRASKAQQ